MGIGIRELTVGPAEMFTWKVLTKLHCSPHHATAIIAAITVLQHTEDDRYSR